MYYKLIFTIKDKHNTEVVYDEELEKNVERYIYEEIPYYTECEEKDMCVETLKNSPPEDFEVPLGYELVDVKVGVCSVNNFIKDIKE
jgi:hypothetical protein